MWKYNNSDELYHWGVLGMKWGHRKDKNNIISKIKKEYNIYKEANKKDKSVKVANIIGGVAAIGAGGIYGFSKKSGIYNRGMKLAQISLKAIGNASFTYGTAMGLLNYKNYKNKNKKYNYYNESDNKNNKKKSMSMKKKILIGSGIATALVGGYLGGKKILELKSKKDILKRYPIEKINGLGLDADYAKHYLENFKRIHKLKK